MNKKRIKQIEPKNKKQREFLNAISELPVVFAVGSAGSGKTFLAAAQAYHYLSYEFVDRIVIVRPAIATEDLGYLPGDMKEKLDPYLLPLMDAFSDLSNPKMVQDLVHEGAIEVAALAFMRGRTFNNAFIVLDEAQNTTIDQMKMFLTRFGENVKVVITGDPTQSDIRGENGLQWATRKLRSCKSVAIIQYENKDVVRSALVRDILNYLEKNETTNDSSVSNSEEDTREHLPEFIRRAINT
jgi:phosphate starvation-inducible protein PhoH and related proteins